ncbi:MAG TPA: hypothetical protein VGL56_13420 [Fimbriimonadaceae bacterium]|jgi:hypothetical protein
MEGVQPISKDPLQGYKRWFYAATAYNFLWGLIAILAPYKIFLLLGIPPFQPMEAFQCIGMIVGVYAYGYYLLARDPVRYSGLIWVGLAGKTFGPIGFVFAALQGHLPWSFGFNLLFNDLIWWPVFWSFALRYARKPL